MNKGTRTFIYGFFLMALGASCIYVGYDSYLNENYFLALFRGLIGTFLLWQGADKIQKTTY